MKKKVGSGRPKLAPEERARRQALRSQKLRQHMEAKRRAWFVLEHKYKDQFTTLYNKEFKALGKEKRFVVEK